MRATTLDRERLAAYVMLAAVTLVGLRAAVSPLWDADIWWILRAGESVLSGAGVPRVNAWSFTAPRHPWVMHEWLYGALCAALVRLGGLSLLAWPRLVAVAVAAWSSWRIAAREAPPWVASLAVCASLGVFGGRFESPRPVGVCASLAVLCASMAFAPRLTRAQAVAYALVCALWANLHGSAPLGAVIALCALATPGDRVHRALACVGSVAALFATPYGASLPALVARYLTGAPDDAVALVHARIVEWWPLWRDPLRVATPLELCVAMALAAVWIFALGDARWRPRAALGLALLAMALRHNRHLALAGLVGVPLAAGPLASRWGASAGDAVSSGVRRIAGPMACALLAWALAAATWSPSRWADPTDVDDAVRDAVRALPDGARVFAALPFTGWVIWHGAPRVTVFYDTRNDCYPAEVLREGLDANDGLLTAARTDELLRSRRSSHAIVRCDGPTARALAGWTRVSSRAGVCVFAATSPAVAPR